MRYRIWNFKLKRFFSKLELQELEISLTKNGDLVDKEFIFMRSAEMWDKTGKEIFEGDIVSNKDGVFTVEYFSQAFRYGEIGDYLANTYSHTDKVSHKEVSTFKVIGNIYSNPELIPNNRNRR